MNDFSSAGIEMYKWITDLFRINRSLTGPGVLQTLGYIQELIPGLVIQSVETGFSACGWTVPVEWSVDEAYIETLDGVRVVDFQDNNLHLVGYSTPIDAIVESADLQKHLYSLPSQPTAIPYVTSYYERTWGFCVSENMRQSMTESAYHCVIASKLCDGHLHYADLVLNGASRREIVFSSYICHPSMANNELSGPALLTFIARLMMSTGNQKYTYRFVLAPETIGALVYIEKMGRDWPKDVIGIFNLTCVGDNRSYSLLASRTGDTYIDKVARFVMGECETSCIEYDYTTRGSDERQYNSPLVNIPTVSMMRSKYNTFPEYHTSLDNMELVSPDGLQGAYDVHLRAIHIIETNCKPCNTCRGEPQLSKYGLYSTLSIKRKHTRSRDFLNVLAYSDGINDLIDIATRIELGYEDVLEIVTILADVGLILLRSID